ncbi:MAG: FIST C-terminal domain-containing protein [Hyphomicrobiales bacterium]|nr:FIST C-terminal domain-containing protein [Hyphomicrobiales bacterium]
MAQGLARTYTCGVRCAAWPAVEPEAALAFAAADFAGLKIGLLLVFGAATAEPNAVAASILRHFPATPHIACSTAGEIGPDGYAENSIVVVALPADGFHASTLAIEDLSGIEFADVVRRVERLRQDHDAAPPPGFENAEGFALSFIDGLSRREELFVSAMHRALEHLPILGGSTGDDLEFRRTWCITGGRVLSDAGVLALVRTRHRFSAFRHDNFEPTDVRLVVTECDQEARTVRELNAAPAAREYADSIGVDASQLDSMSFASHPVVVKVGGEYYCRSIGHANPDGSLTFFCAMETGVVLTMSRSRHLVESAHAAFKSVTNEIGGADFVLGFDCALRRLDAENRQLKRELSDVYRDYGVIGFNTYGEQFGAMHLNQTFTGLAIGARSC